jgi:hypothetical protein
VSWDNTVPRELASVLRDRGERDSKRAAKWLKRHESDDAVWEIIGEALDKIEQLALQWPSKDEIARAQQMGIDYAKHEIAQGQEIQEAPLSGEWADGLTDRQIAFGVDFTYLENLEGVLELGNAWETGYFDTWQEHADALAEAKTT